MANSTTADIRGRSARLRRLLTWVSVVLWSVFVLERFGGVGFRLIREGPAAEPLRRLMVELVAAAPEVFFLLSLWWIREALAAFARGDLYAPTITRMLERVGAMLAAGAFIEVFLVPTADRLLGSGPGYWVAFDVSGVVLGAVGLSLGVIARVLRRASEVQAELDEIF